MPEKNVFLFQFDNLWKKWQLFKKKPEGVRIIYVLGINVYLLDIILFGIGFNRFYAAVSILNFVFRLRWAYPKYADDPQPTRGAAKDPNVPPRPMPKVKPAIPSSRRKK